MYQSVRVMSPEMYQSVRDMRPEMYKSAERHEARDVPKC